MWTLLLGALGPVVGFIFKRLGLSDDQTEIFFQAWRAAQNKTLIAVQIAESEVGAMAELEQRRKLIRERQKAEAAQPSLPLGG